MNLNPVCFFLYIFPEGSTERVFLTNIETIVIDKLKSYFADPESAKEVLLDKDFGSKQETITLTGSGTCYSHYTVI